jgi:hypothetical protein
VFYRVSRRHCTLALRRLPHEKPDAHSAEQPDAVFRRRSGMEGDERSQPGTEPDVGAAERLRDDAAVGARKHAVDRKQNRVERFAFEQHVAGDRHLDRE